VNAPRAVAIFFAAAWLAAVPAAAGTLSTTFVKNPPDGDILCNVVNGGKKTIEVVIRVRNITGEILVESDAIPIPPQQGNGIGDNANDDYFGWCEFEVKGSTRGVRASLQLETPAADEPLVVVPAQ
jgi:hypothetical protein